MIAACCCPDAPINTATIIVLVAPLVLVLLYALWIWLFT